MTSDSGSRLVYVSLAVAVLSFCGSLYQAYLFTRQVDIMQRNVGRGEYMRTCKEVIDAYFQVKLKTSALSSGSAGEPARAVDARGGRLEAAAAVSRFAALGTYLANFQDEAIRARYSELSHMLQTIADKAGATPRDELTRLFEPADKLFAAMNEDCVRSARGMALLPSARMRLALVP